LTFFIAFIVFGILTNYYIRRAAYEVFYYSHVAFVPIFIAVVLWHATMSWYYITASLALLTADVAIRLGSAVGASVIVDDITVEVPANPSTGTGGVVKLSYKVSKFALNLDKLSWKRTAHGPLRHAMGQYAWINIPEIDPIAWHPFTISSAPLDERSTHHIKSMGTGANKDGQWTNALYNLVVNRKKYLDSQQQANNTKPIDVALPKKFTLRCRVEGPYGSVLEVERYSHILLVGGGIGITPLHSVIR
jgi:respiratory burst oxidase